MSRYSAQTSYGHHIQKLFSDCYRISWTVDHYYTGTRGRFQRTFTRDTDETGARRFAKKWEIEFEFNPPTGANDGE